MKRATPASILACVLFVAPALGDHHNPASTQPASQPVTQPASQPSTQPNDASLAAFQDVIAIAHGKEAYTKHAALQAEVTVKFGGKTMIQGVMTFDTPLGRSRIESGNGMAMVLDGQDAWVAPADAPIPPGMARFHLLTWPYFAVAPFKLHDPGTTINPIGAEPLDAETILRTAKLTFDAGTGDAPDDWYLLYRDTDTHRLKAMAYIVTYGKNAEDAEKEPHVAIYEAFTDVQGVVLPTRMTIWNWEAGVGKVGEELGSMELSNYRFIELDESMFTKPDGARIDALPTSGNEE